MFVTRRRILTLALLLSAVSGSGSAAAQCLHYGDVSLTGRLVQQTYPGPPDFESATKGDEPLVIWILQLDTGVCIISSDASYANAYNQREIQLVFGTDQYRHLLGKKIAVTGRLVPGGGKYEKPFVITSPAIKELF